MKYAFFSMGRIYQMFKELARRSYSKFVPRRDNQNGLG